MKIEFEEISADDYAIVTKGDEYVGRIDTVEFMFVPAKHIYFQPEELMEIAFQILKYRKKYVGE